MNSVKPSALTTKKSKLARTFAKVLHIRALSGITPTNGIQKVKARQEVRDDLTPSKSTESLSGSFESSDEELNNRAAMEALLAKLFSTISTVKAAYAQIQYAQSPLDTKLIEAADQTAVKELEMLSELKMGYLKKQVDPSPETTMILAEIQEQQSILKTYEITGKKLESQVLLKDSEIIFLSEKLAEMSKHNKLLEKRLNQSGPESLHISGLNADHLKKVVRRTVKSVRSFVRLIMEEMKSANWDFNVAAMAIEPDVVYYKDDDKCYAFEAFVCREMFDCFHFPNFSLPNESLPGKSKQPKLFFERFMNLKAMKANEYLLKNQRSTFAKFCQVKYCRLIHPKMESSFSGNLTQRTLVNSGQFPDTIFFNSFSEMAKWVWLLHCLSFSSDPEAEIFQADKGCRFSEVYMESITDEVLIPPGCDPPVSFTVFPGFKVGKTIIQTQVYLHQSQQKSDQSKASDSCAELARCHWLENIWQCAIGWKIDLKCVKC